MWKAYGHIQKAAMSGLSAAEHLFEYSSRWKRTQNQMSAGKTTCNGAWREAIRRPIAAFIINLQHGYGSIVVVGNTINDRICQRTVTTAEPLIPFLKCILGAENRWRFLRLLWSSSKSSPFVLHSSKFPREATHPESGTTDLHTSPWFFCSYYLSCWFRINKQIRKTDILGIEILLTSSIPKAQAM